MAERIIVVDSDADTQALTLAQLRRAGWEGLGFNYESINLTVLLQLNAALIVIDFDEQYLGQGWSLIQLLKMEDATARIPIIITSNGILIPLDIRAYLAGRYIHVVTKPFDIDRLITLIKSTLAAATQAGSLYTSEDNTAPLLVVEDNEPLRSAITEILGFENYAVHAANNGLMALDSVYQFDYRLIMTDLGMPVMNGLDFLSAYGRQLRAHSPVIIISAEADLLPPKLPYFVVDVVPKPFRVEQLVRLVKQYAMPS